MAVGPYSPAGPDYETLHAPHRHGRFVRTVFTLSAQDPRCSPNSALPVAFLMLFGFLFSGVWQIAAVYVAGTYELGIKSTIPLLVTGVLVALLVVAFDWDIVHKRIRGESRLPMLVVRFVFVAIMALLVSEAVAGWVFDKDITRQVEVGNDQQKAIVAARVDQDTKAIAVLDARLDVPNKKVRSAQQAVDDAQAEMDRQDQGFHGADEGKGPLYEQAKYDRDTAQRELDDLTAAQQDTRGVVDEQKKAIANAQAEFRTAHPIVDPADLGPAEREQALWTYLLDNPDALLLRRVPLTILLVFFDLLAVILGWSVSRRIRQRHIDWYAEVDQHEERARRRRRVLADAQADEYMHESLGHISGWRSTADAPRPDRATAPNDLRGAHAAAPAPADHPAMAEHNRAESDAGEWRRESATERFYDRDHANDRVSRKVPETVSRASWVEPPEPVVVLPPIVAHSTQESASHHTIDLRRAEVDGQIEQFDQDRLGSTDRLDVEAVDDDQYLGSWRNRPGARRPGGV